MLFIPLVWYILKQSFALVAVNSGGYLPCGFAARQISTTIHLSEYYYSLVNICQAAKRQGKYSLLIY